MNKKFISTILMFILIILSISSFSFAEDWGCCVDTVVGCTNVYTPEDINACESAGYDFQLSESCFPIPGKDLKIIDNPFCAQEGCCCIDDSFQESLTNDQCSSLGGSFSSNTNCYDACSIEFIPQETTCDTLGGFWCSETDKDPLSTDLSATLETYDGRPTDAFSCFSLPCINLNPESCEDKGLPEICSNGIDDDGDCLADTADSDCGHSVQGSIVDIYGRPISNVKLKFVNIDHINNPDAFGGFKDSFITYSIGEKGEFFFTGLSLNTYNIVVVDNYYKNKYDDVEFTLNINHKFESGQVIEVVPRNAFSIEGVVSSTGDNVEDALVSIEGTSLNTITDSEGYYRLNHIIIDNPNFHYTVTAFKDSFSPISSKFKSAPAGDVIEVNLNMYSNTCLLNPSKPILTNVTNIKGSTDLSLSFNSGGCEADTVYIYRCEGDCENTKSGFTLIDTLEGSVTEYYDDSINLKWDTLYTYFIKTEQGGRSSISSNLFIIATGNELCKDKENTGLFCIYDTSKVSRQVTSSKSAYCDKNNIVVEGDICPSNSQCVESNSGTLHSETTCKILPDCAPELNNLFGLYFTKDSCQSTDMCVFDYSRTNIDSCFSCNEYSSCFSYKSETSCGENICGVGNCDWSITDTTINSGICYDSSKSSCSDCNNPFNKVFGICDQNTCEEIGDCSFSGLSGTCDDCATTSCYDYIDVDSCTGNNYNLRLFSRTNLLSSFSKDTCSIGSCSWDIKTNTCFKDRDVNGVDDCINLLSRPMLDSSGRGLSAYTHSVCLKDKVPPLTSATFDVKSFNPFDPIGGEIQVLFDATDSSSQSTNKYDVPEIYYCIEPAGSNFCRTKTHGNSIGTFERVSLMHPNGSKMLILKDINSRLKITPNGDKEFPISVGRNVLKFFSVDYANNLEEIRSEDFFVDKTPPTIKVNLVRDADYSSKKTNLGVYVISDEPVYCSIELDNCIDLGNCDPNSDGFDEQNIDGVFIDSHYSMFKPLFSRTLNGLNDGHNSLDIVCVDLAGNYVTTTEEFLLDVDPRIQNPLPVGVTDKTSLTLSVDTISQVGCRYTFDLNKEFSDIPSRYELSISKSGELYHHSKTISLTESKEYSIYVKCDYNPGAIEKINFRIDKIKPTVFAALSTGEPLDNIGWISTNDVTLNCEDLPTGGFGCSNISYCKKKVPNVNNFDLISSCTPNLDYTGDLDLLDPSTICFNAKENIKHSEGGLISETVCRNIFVDLDDPQLVLDFLPSSINKNMLTITGKVYDSFTFDTTNFELNKDHDSILTNTDYYSTFIGGVSSINEFDFLTSIDFTSISHLVSSGATNAAANGKVYLFFQYNSKNNFGALVFDLIKNEIAIGIKNSLFGFKEIERVSVEPSYFDGMKEVRLTRDATGISALVKDRFSKNDLLLKTSDSIFKKLYNGAFGALLEDKSQGSIFSNNLKSSFGELKLYYEGVEPFKSLDKKVHFKINNNVKDIFTTSRDFKLESKITEGTPSHGNSYTVSFVARDLARRTSEVIEKEIIYDLSGPTLDSINFHSLSNQDSYDYVEYSSNSKVLVDIVDDYSGVSEVKLIIRDLTFKVPYNSKTNSFEGVINTSNLPAGLHDIIIESRDGIGNLNIETLENNLLIEDRIDPLINLQLDNQFFNTPTPTIYLTTDEVAMCSASYISESGTVSNVKTSSGLSKDHEIKIITPLIHKADYEIETEILLICNDEHQNKVSMVLDVIVDLRLPLYYITSNLDDLSLTSKTRHNISLLSVRPADRSFYSFGDEPIKCRYSEDISADFSNMNNFIVDYKFTTTDRSKPFLITSGSKKELYFRCEDRAGNIGQLKYISVIAKPTALPQLFALDTELSITSESTTNSINFNTIRKDIVCNYKLDSESYAPVLQVSTSSIFINNEIDLSNLNDGEHSVDISCESSIGKTIKTVKVHKQSTAPVLSQFNLDGYSESETITTNSSNFLISFKTDRDTKANILNNGILINEDLGTHFDLNINLNYGYNDLSILVTDLAGNIFTKSISVLSLHEHPSVSFSNNLGGSIRNNYAGNIIIKGDIKNTKVFISYLGKNLTKTVVSNYDTQTAESYFNISLDSSELLSLITSTSLNHLEFNEHSKNYPITVTVKQHDNIYSELFYYNPFAEDISLMHPATNIISESDLLNYNSLKLDGRFNQENYITESVLKFQQISDIFDSSQDLDVILGSFKNNLELSSANYLFSISATNDLGVSFGIFSSILYDSEGPNPKISLYPQGEISFSSRPQFNIKFRNPGMIISAQVLSEDLNTEFNIAEFDKTLTFLSTLKLASSLSEEGIYYLNILAEDNNANVEESQFKFIYSKAPFNIELVEPSTGVSPSEKFTAEFLSDRLASCSYSFEKSSFDSKTAISSISQDHNFELNIANGNSKIIYLQCKDFEDSITDELSFSLSVDTSAPLIKSILISNSEMISSLPYITSYPLKAIFNISTDDDSFCKYELNIQGDLPTLDFSDMVPLGCNGSECYSKFIFGEIGNLLDSTSYTVDVLCKNRAGLLSARKQIDFQVDLSQGDRIIILSPIEFTNSKTVKIGIKTSLPTSDCKYGFNLDPIKNTFSRHSSDGLYHNASITLKTGKHNLKVACNIDGDMFYENETFIIDSTKPLTGTIIAADVSNSFVRLSSRAINFTDNESGIKLFEYAIGTSPYGRNGWNAISNWTQSERQAFTAQNLNLSKGTTYYWTVRALNRVNMYSKEASSLGTLADIERIFENVSIDSCSDGIRNSGEPAVDCGPSCMSPCREGDSCITDDDCYSSNLLCSDDFLCTSGVFDLGENISISTYEEEELDIPIEYSETNVPITKKNNSWIFWLLSIFLLVGVAGGGYYAYSVYFSREEDGDVSIPGSPLSTGSVNPNSGAQSKVKTLSPAEIARMKENKLAEERAVQKAAEIAKKKEDLKKALKKKLVDTEKKDKDDQRDSMFANFGNGSTTKKPSDKPISKSPQLLEREKQAKATRAKVSKLKSAMNSNHSVKTNILSHPDGISVSENKIRSMHSDLVNSSTISDSKSTSKVTPILKKNRFENKRVAKKSRSIRDSLKNFDSNSTSKKTNISKKVKGKK